MDSMIRTFAQQLLRKLQPGPVAPRSEDLVEEVDRKINTDEDGIVKVEPAAAMETREASESPSVSPSSQTKDDDDENMEDGQITPDELIQTPYLPDRIQLPAQKVHVLQHVELLFALSVKASDLLDESAVLDQFMTRCLFTLQDLCFLWRDGYDRPGSYSGAHHRSCAVPWAHPWETANIASDLSSWRRVTRSPYRQNIHPEWSTQSTDCGTCQGVDH